ncbi:hypothetical protein LAZ67_15000438 [Cordylochernes scorpioides]|uniref:RNase H type-1 domain-containing protein n=1 Tax=Cordylochernes scorpioides TaxID=51811 RepID=A0ABY6L8V4_9ARAC|nr:hypothetical protein LAZ67_15000438 [Cordylochernes scorpioides]
MYLGILRRLREAIRKKRPEKWTNGGWILHHDNARPHTAHLMTSFLAKNGTQILLQPPYFPDIAPNDFFLFPKLEAVLKGRHFDTRDDIIEKSPLALKNIPKEAYKNCFDNWEKRWRCKEPLLKSIAKSVNRLPANSSVTVQWLPAHVGIPGNMLAESLAKAGALGLPEARESTTQLDERDLLRTIKTQCLQEWKSEAAHDWYRAGGTSTVSVLPREQQSLISRLKSGHLRTMTFQNDCRVFPLFTKCNSQPATPRHIIDCIDSSIDELYSSPADTIKNLKLYKLDTLV